MDFIKENSIRIINKNELRKLKHKKLYNLLLCFLGKFYPYNHSVKVYKDFYVIKIHNNKIKIKKNRLYLFIFNLINSNIDILGFDYIDGFIYDFMINKVQINQFKNQIKVI